MKTSTTYTLIDGSNHATIKQAKEHCLEQMGAGMRGVLVDIASGGAHSEYKAALKLVSEKKYDKAILEYVAWRKEHDALEKYEDDLWHGREPDDDDD